MFSHNKAINAKSAEREFKEETAERRVENKNCKMSKSSITNLREKLFKNSSVVVCLFSCRSIFGVNKACVHQHCICNLKYC